MELRRSDVDFLSRRAAARRRSMAGMRKSPEPKEGSSRRYCHSGLSAVYPARSRMKWTTSLRVKIAPRSSALADFICSTSTPRKVSGGKSSAAGDSRWMARMGIISKRFQVSVTRIGKAVSGGKEINGGLGGYPDEGGKRQPSGRVG